MNVTPAGPTGFGMDQQGSDRGSPASPDSGCDDEAANHDLKERGRPWSEVRLELLDYLERRLSERK